MIPWKEKELERNLVKAVIPVKITFTNQGPEGKQTQSSGGSERPLQSCSMWHSARRKAEGILSGVDKSWKWH